MLSLTHSHSPKECLLTPAKPSNYFGFPVVIQVTCSTIVGVSGFFPKLFGSGNHCFAQSAREMSEMPFSLSKQCFWMFLTYFHQQHVEKVGKENVKRSNCRGYHQLRMEFELSSRTISERTQMFISTAQLGNCTWPTERAYASQPELYFHAQKVYQWVNLIALLDPRKYS